MTLIRRRRLRDNDRDMPRCGIPRSDVADRLIGDEARSDALRRAPVFGEHIGDPWCGWRDLVAPGTRRHGAVAEHHRRLHSIPKTEPDGLREQATGGQRLLARILETGKHDEADGAALRCQGRERSVRSAEQIAIGLVGGESGELVDQNDNGRAVEVSDVLSRLAREVLCSLLHRGDGIFEQDHRALGVGGEPREQRTSEGEFHAALAVEPPHLDEAAVDRFGESE